MPLPSNATSAANRRVSVARAAGDIVEAGVEIGSLVDGQDLLAADPLQHELTDLIARARIREELARPALDALRLIELARGRGGEQRILRRGAEERVRECRRDLGPGEAEVIACCDPELGAIEEVRRHQHRLHRCREIRAREPVVLRALLVRERAAEDPRPERIDQLRATGRGVPGPVAGEQRGGVRDGVVRERLRRGEERIDVRRGHHRRRGVGIEREARGPGIRDELGRRIVGAGAAQREDRVAPAEAIGHRHGRARIRDPLALVEDELVLVAALADRERPGPQAGRRVVGEREPTGGDRAGPAVEAARDVHARERAPVRIEHERLGIARARLAGGAIAAIAERAVGGARAAHRGRTGAEQISHGRAILATREQPQPARTGWHRVAAQRAGGQPRFDERRDVLGAIAGALTGVVRGHPRLDRRAQPRVAEGGVLKRGADPTLADLAVADLAHLLVQDRAAARRRIVGRSDAAVIAAARQDRQADRCRATHRRSGDCNLYSAATPRCCSVLTRRVRGRVADRNIDRKVYYSSALCEV